MKKQTKVKLSLISTIGVSLLAVSSAAVSTFAWFQAQAQVNVSASSADPVEITVSAPDAIQITTALFAYDNNTANGYTTNVPTSYTQFTTAITSSDVFSNLYPGRKMSFMIKLTSSSKIPALSLELSSLNSTNATKSNLKVLNSSKNAVDQSASINILDTTQMKASMSLGDFGLGNPGIFSGALQGKITEHEKRTFSELANQVASNNTFTAYLFYTVSFEDVIHYLEYKKIDSSTYERLYTTPSDSSSSERFFAQDNDNGNSTCFAGLSFGLASLSIAV